MSPPEFQHSHAHVIHPVCLSRCLQEALREKCEEVAAKLAALMAENLKMRVQEGQWQAREVERKAEMDRMRLQVGAGGEGTKAQAVVVAPGLPWQPERDVLCGGCDGCLGRHSSGSVREVGGWAAEPCRSGGYLGCWASGGWLAGSWDPWLSPVKSLHLCVLGM